MEEQRLSNLEQLQQLGETPFLSDGVTESINYDEGKSVTLSGRITTIRRVGKMCFANVLFGKLQKIQVVFQEGITETGWKEIVKYIDIGDILQFNGFYKQTQSGEKSIFVNSFKVLVKALSTVAYGQQKNNVSYNEIRDTENLMRHRHLALLTNEELHDNLIYRSRMISRIRKSLDSQNFLEVNTPILLENPGGAEAKTFDTHYNAYDADVKLRISLEIQLKKLLCGGFERVYEIGTVFRNEGISSNHNPEFTLLEYYSAYDNFDQGIGRFKSLVSSAFERDIDWDQITMRDAILLYAKEDISNWFRDSDFAEKVEIAMKDYVEPNLSNPTLITHHPACISPLARSIDGVYAERFEAYINGVEIANGFCEQNNPIVQLSAFEKQDQPVDQDFIYALSCGMPPAFGCGIGIDRLAMILTSTNHIRKISWFPFTKPKG